MRRKRNGISFRVGFWMGVMIFLLTFWGAGKEWVCRNNVEKMEGRDEEEKEGDALPRMELLQNVWIMEESGDTLLFFWKGEVRECPMECGSDREPAEHTIADLVLLKGKVTHIVEKENRIHGTVHDWDEGHVSLEEYGEIPLDDQCENYRVYGTPQMMHLEDLKIGSDQAEFVLDDGKICAILFVREAAMLDIRVLLKTSDYKDLFHKEIILKGDQMYSVRYQDGKEWREEKFEADRELVIDADSPYLRGEEHRMIVSPMALTGSICLKNVHRSMGEPHYTGKVEISAYAEGMIAVNLLPLEEYLYWVVPSEMPASYPEEALKAQAICARTYAYGKMQQAAYPTLGAHLDDSVQYQVYHNIERQGRTDAAVRDTYGVILITAEGEPAETYYYSTSCGRGTDEKAWGKTGRTHAYLQGKRIRKGDMEKADDTPDHLMEEDDADYECKEPWYRWSYRVEKMDRDAFRKRLIQCLHEEGLNFTEIHNLVITERGSGGIALCLEVETEQGTFCVEGEHTIREVLCDGHTSVMCHDGRERVCATMLPSAFFLLEPSQRGENVVGYTLKGGGYGHGIGMSQNGAKGMAEDGMTANAILAFFYEGTDCTNVYGELLPSSQQTETDG